LKSIILAALLAAQSTTPEPSKDRAAVISSLLQELAGEQRIPHRRPAGRPMCVSKDLTQSPLAARRQPDPSDMKFDAPIGKPRLRWKPDTEEEARARLWWIDPEMPSDQKVKQKEIQDAALLVSKRSRTDGSRLNMESTWLAASQKLQTGECPETISLSEPDIAIDYAFINVEVECGALCGLSAMYVMHRQNGRWETVDGRIDLIS
jgi:hypothetical protein